MSEKPVHFDIEQRALLFDHGIIQLVRHGGTRPAPEN
jgi:hypothetical protein